MLLTRFARSLAFAAAIGPLAYACTVGDVDYVGKTCSGGGCPNGLACVNGFCEPPQPDASDAQAFPDTGFDCAAHAFCDDFTVGETLGGKWDLLTRNGTTMAIDTDAWTSPPSSLLVDIPDGSTSVTGALQKAFHLTSALPHIAFNWDMRVDAASADKAVQTTLFTAAVSDPDYNTYGWNLYLGTTNWTFLVRAYAPDGGPALGTPPISVPPLAVGTWRHVTVDIFTAPTSSFVISFDGQSVTSGAMPSLVHATTFTTSFAVTGTGFTDGTHGWTFRFDNFTEDALAQ